RGEREEGRAGEEDKGRKGEREREEQFRMQNDTASKLSISQQRHADHFVSVLHQANLLFYQGGGAIQEGLALFDMNSSNIELAQRRAASRALLDNKAAELSINYAVVGAQVLSLRQRPHDIINWQEVALAAARQFQVQSRIGVLLNLM